MNNDEIIDRVESLLRNRRFNDLVYLIEETPWTVESQGAFAEALSRWIPRAAA